MNGVRAGSGMAVRTDENSIVGRLLMAFRTVETGVAANQGQGVIENGLMPGGVAILMTLIAGSGITRMVWRPFIISLMTTEAGRAFAGIASTLVAVRTVQGLVYSSKRPGVVFIPHIPGDIIGAMAQITIGGKSIGQMIRTVGSGIILLVTGLAILTESMKNALIMAIPTVSTFVVPLGDKTGRMLPFGRNKCIQAVT